MGRIIGMDVGKKRIGLAVTDPLGIFATGLDTIPASEIFGFLSGYVEKEKVDAFVVGSPMTLGNAPSEAARYIEPFIDKLTEKFPGVPVKRIDERFTSKMARQAILDGGIRKMARRDKAMVDKISAVILLQSFLDQQKN